MSKEKTRAELSAEVARLKDDLQVTDSNLQNATIAHRELKEKYDALVSEHTACEKSLDRANTIADERAAGIKRLNARVEYLEGELKEKTELNEKQGERIQNYSESIERIRADRDKAQYIAADLLEHGIFHFLVVKYRNLRAK